MEKKDLSLWHTSPKYDISISDKRHFLCRFGCFIRKDISRQFPLLGCYHYRCSRTLASKRELMAFFIYITQISSTMPKYMKLRVKSNNSTLNSASDRTKSVITLCMVFLTIVNPLLFVLPAALCGYVFYYRKGGIHEN